MQDVIRRVYGKGGERNVVSPTRGMGEKKPPPPPPPPPRPSFSCEIFNFSLLFLPPLHKSLFHFRMHSSGVEWGMELGRGDACLCRRSVSFWSDVHSARGRGQNFFPPAEKPCWVTHTHKPTRFLLGSVLFFLFADEKQPCKPVGGNRAPFYFLFFGLSPLARRARVKVMQHCFSPPKKFSQVTLGSSGYHRIPFPLHHLKTFSRLSALVFLPGKEGHCSFSFSFQVHHRRFLFGKGERGRRREGIFFQPFLRDASQFARGENGHPPRSREDAPPPKSRLPKKRVMGLLRSLIARLQRGGGAEAESEIEERRRPLFPLPERTRKVPQ